jgi:hypothetical protein
MNLYKNIARNKTKYKITDDEFVFDHVEFQTKDGKLNIGSNCNCTLRFANKPVARQGNSRIKLHRAKTEINPDTTEPPFVGGITEAAAEAAAAAAANYILDPEEVILRNLKLIDMNKRINEIREGTPLIPANLYQYSNNVLLNMKNASFKSGPIVPVIKVPIDDDPEQAIMTQEVVFANSTSNDNIELSDVQRKASV